MGKFAQRHPYRPPRWAPALYPISLLKAISVEPSKFGRIFHTEFNITRPLKYAYFLSESGLLNFWIAPRGYNVRGWCYYCLYIRNGGSSHKYTVKKLWLRVCAIFPQLCTNESERPLNLSRTNARWYCVESDSAYLSCLIYEYVCLENYIKFFLVLSCVLLAFIVRMKIFYPSENLSRIGNTMTIIIEIIK